MSNILNLIERVEKASGPDRELDEAIAIALGLYVREKRGRDRQEWFYRVGGEDFERRSTARYAGTDGLPRYTDSLDAVMALNEQDLAWTLGKNVHHGYWHASCNSLNADGAPYSLGCSSACATPVLALLSAILKSRLATNGGGDSHE